MRPSTAGATARCSRTCRRCASTSARCTRWAGPGGPCDLGAGFDGGIDSRIAAVWPFFGQFVAHDITADRSPLVDRADPARLRNFRVPQGQPRRRLRHRPGRRAIPVSPGRPGQAPALAVGFRRPAKPRGDRADRRSAQRRRSCSPARCWWRSSGLHNRLVDRLRDDDVAEPEVFEEARRSATWHYQHVILREFLPGLIGAALTAELLEHGPRLYRVDG